MSVGGLQVKTRYYYRVVSTNSAGCTQSELATFNTTGVGEWVCEWVCECVCVCVGVCVCVCVEVCGCVGGVVASYSVPALC